MARGRLGFQPSGLCPLFPPGPGARVVVGAHAPDGPAGRRLASGWGAWEAARAMFWSYQDTNAATRVGSRPPFASRGQGPRRIPGACAPRGRRARPSSPRSRRDSDGSERHSPLKPNPGRLFGPIDQEARRAGRSSLGQLSGRLSCARRFPPVMSGVQPSGFPSPLTSGWITDPLAFSRAWHPARTATHVGAGADHLEHESEISATHRPNLRPRGSTRCVRSLVALDGSAGGQASTSYIRPTFIAR